MTSSYAFSRVCRSQRLRYFSIPVLSCVDPSQTVPVLPEESPRSAPAIVLSVPVQEKRMKTNSSIPQRQMRRYPKRFIETLSENGPPALRMSDDKRIARLRLRFRPSYPGISACIRISKHVPILSSIGRGKRRLQREQTRTANASQSPEQPHHRNPKRPLQSDPSGRQSLCFGLLPGFRALDAGCQQNAHFVQRIERHDDQKQAEHVGRRNNGGYNS